LLGTVLFGVHDAVAKHHTHAASFAATHAAHPCPLCVYAAHLASSSPSDDVVLPLLCSCVVVMVVVVMVVVVVVVVVVALALALTTAAITTSKDKTIIVRQKR
jgi:hypothetical protein